MKLAKLSLAAILAAGTFSVANATSLENAIKGVSFNGMLRVRFYNESPKNANNYNRWRTNGIFIFGVPVGNNLKMVYKLSTRSNVYTDDDQLLGDTSTTGTVDAINSATLNNLLYLQYSNGPVNAIAGKIPVMTPITSNDPVTPGRGAGVIASYNVGNGFTVAGAYVDALESETISLAADNTATSENLYTVTDSALGNNIYAAAAMYKNDMVNAQAWYFHAVNLLKYVYTLQATVTPVAGVTLHGDFASSKLADNIDPSANNKTYYNLSAGYAANGLCAQVGFARTDKNVGVISLGGDAPIGNVLPTADRTNISNLVDTNAWYGKIGYNVNSQTNVYVAYSNINDKTVADNDSNEYTLGAGYKYNKKLTFSAYYDILNYKNDGLTITTHDLNDNVTGTSSANDNNEFRFEAKYIF